MRFNTTKPLVWLALLCSYFSVNAQHSTQLAELVASYQSQYHEKSMMHLISSDKSNGAIYDQEVVEKLVKEAKPFIEISINTLNEAGITLQLVKNEVFSDAHSQSVMYRGIVKDSPNSIATIAFQGDKVHVNIELGTIRYTITPSKADHQKAIIKKESDSTQQSHWSCHGDMIISDPLSIKPSDPKPVKDGAMDSVNIYIETDYALYAALESEQEVEDYVERVMNRVSSIYFNENIVVAVSDLSIWSVPDPYDYTTSLTALQSFGDQLPCDFNGDLAHLISARSENLGGVAYVQGILSREHAIAFSNVVMDEEVNPYSWDVNVITHEIGHNLGSRHTHDCVWGPNNNEAIDGCYVKDACNTKPIPAEGGTIMSYCHLRSEGINLNLGFGPQPGNMIRFITGEYHSRDGYTIANAIEIDEIASAVVPTLNKGYGAYQPDANHAFWYKFVPQYDMNISINNCGQGVDSRLHIYTGSCQSLTQIATSDDDCSSSGSYRYASQIVDLPIIAGTTYYIEWDSKWSYNGFTFELSYDYELPHCDNGVQDADETGIDCGGAQCIPCKEMPDCTNDVSLPTIVTENTMCLQNQLIAYGGAVTDTAQLILSSPVSIELNPGFEVVAGAQLEIDPAECHETVSASL
jgi:hypothetical protein